MKTVSLLPTERALQLSYNQTRPKPTGSKPRAKPVVILLLAGALLAACTPVSETTCRLPQVASIQSAPVHMCNENGMVSAFGSWLPPGTDHF